MLYSSLETFLSRLNEISSASLYICGAGKYGDILGKYFLLNGISFLGYFDKDNLKKELNGKKVFNYKDIKSKAYYIVSSVNKKEYIHNELVNVGVPEDSILEFDDNFIIYSMLDFVRGSKNSHINSFHNLYEGERCFIIGNGPSLATDDLNKLIHEKTFGCNSVYKIFKFTNWKPTFYCFGDAILTHYFATHENQLEIILNNCDNIFMGYGNCIEIDSDKIVPIKIKSRKSNVFSDDCSKFCYGGGSVTYVMLQLAVYLGFKEIYLLGIDFSFSEERYKDGSILKNDNVINHNELIENEIIDKAVLKEFGTKYFAEIDVQQEAFETAKQYADAHDIHIYNATRGGKLEVFPRVDFDSLF